MSLSPFIEARLLDEVRYGFRSGFTYGVGIKRLKSGGEVRNIRYDQPEYRFVAEYGNIKPADYAPLLAMAHVARGPGRGFRFRDWVDYTIEGQAIAVGTGAPQVVQIAKIYVEPISGETQARVIKKPVAGTLQLSAPGGVSGVSLDATTGELAFTASDGAPVTIDYLEFDVPVRLESDEFVSQITRHQALKTNIVLVQDTALQ